MEIGPFELRTRGDYSSPAPSSWHTRWASPRGGCNRRPIEKLDGMDIRLPLFLRERTKYDHTSQSFLRPASHEASASLKGGRPCEI
jgi:hypothetical protein